MPDAVWIDPNRAAHTARVNRRLQLWQAAHFVERLWARDPTLWFTTETTEITDRLGWLDAPETMAARIGEIRTLAESVHQDGYTHVLLLGMGGSSLAPEAYARILGPAPGYPSLTVLDTSHPDAIVAVEASIDLTRTLVVVASKSGTTVETISQMRYFWHRMGQRGAAFIAITDPGTSLEAEAYRRGFRAVIQAQSDVGGRYSALIEFGLVPAALIGIDIETLLNRARAMWARCRQALPNNPGLLLGAVLGENAQDGRDKVTLWLDPEIEAFGDWVEQLLAESTGKDGRGLVPVVHEPIGSPNVYGFDRLIVVIGLVSRAEVWRARLAPFEAQGFPIVYQFVRDPYDIAALMFQWEVATAAACQVLEVHPFNQPDVQQAKDRARAAMARKAEWQDQGGRTPSDRTAIQTFLEQIQPGDYLALQAYLPQDPAVVEVLRAIRLYVRDRFRVATTVGFGPRFLHSTGQLHKGGPDTVVVLQITDEPTHELPVPETDYSFRTLVRAQALGDLEALRERGRRVLPIALGRNRTAGLNRLKEVIEQLGNSA